MANDTGPCGDLSHGVDSVGIVRSLLLKCSSSGTRHYFYSIAFPGTQLRKGDQSLSGLRQRPLRTQCNCITSHGSDTGRTEYVFVDVFDTRTTGSSGRFDPTWRSLQRQGTEVGRNNPVRQPRRVRLNRSRIRAQSPHVGGLGPQFRDPKDICQPTVDKMHIEDDVRVVFGTAGESGVQVTLPHLITSCECSVIDSLNRIEGMRAENL